MGAGILLLVIFFLVGVSLVIWYFAPEIEQQFGWKIKYSLLNRKETWLLLFTFATMGIVGAVDDYLNIKKIGRTKGLPAKLKMGLLILFAALGSWWFYSKLGYDTVKFPWIGSIAIGWLYIPLFIFTMISMANAVNITDGLDGLAG
jgi:phospho-N-acetylmuramoyl-pentapeptide-transferase